MAIGTTLFEKLFLILNTIRVINILWYDEFCNVHHLDGCIENTFFLYTTYKKKWSVYEAMKSLKLVNFNTKCFERKK